MYFAICTEATVQSYEYFVNLDNEVCRRVMSIFPLSIDASITGLGSFPLGKTKIFVLSGADLPMSLSSTRSSVCGVDHIRYVLTFTLESPPRLTS